MKILTALTQLSAVIAIVTERIKAKNMRKVVSTLLMLVFVPLAYTEYASEIRMHLKTKRSNRDYLCFFGVYRLHKSITFLFSSVFESNQAISIVGFALNDLLL